MRVPVSGLWLLNLLAGFVAERSARDAGTAVALQRQALAGPLMPYPSCLTSHSLTLSKAVCYASRRLAPIAGKTSLHEH